MRQYVLSRSAYGPAWDPGANRRRLAVTRAVTARLLARQTVTDWTWIVAFDERDPLLRERMRLYEDSAPRFCPIVWRTPDPVRVAPGSNLARRRRHACADYHAPWRAEVGPADDTVLMSRIDDDDGFALDALERFRVAAEGVASRSILMLPVGFRVWYGRYADVRHERNAMQSLLTPPGDSATVYDYGHTKCAAFAPVTMVDDAPGWLWVRHLDTISVWRKADRRINRRVTGLFPVDWAYLDANWHGRG